MRISDWSSDVCSSDLLNAALPHHAGEDPPHLRIVRRQQFVRVRDDVEGEPAELEAVAVENPAQAILHGKQQLDATGASADDTDGERPVMAHHPLGQRLPAVDEGVRSEEHTSELQSLMRISYAVFCLKK